MAHIAREFKIMQLLLPSNSKSYDIVGNCYSFEVLLLPLEHYDEYMNTN